MLGKCHIVSNVCTLTMLETTILYFKKQYDGFGHDVINEYACELHDFVIGKTFHGPFILWIVGGFLLFLLGTLLPDIDSENSLLGRYIHIPIEHRTWLHTMWIPMIFLIVSIWYPILIWLGLGYMIHLFWDSFSYCGVCYFYPISKYRRYGNGAKVKQKHLFKLYRAGKSSEYVFISMIVILTLALLVMGIRQGLFLPPAK